MEEIFGKGFYRRRGKTVAAAFLGGTFCQIVDDGMAVFPWNHLRKWMENSPFESVGMRGKSGVINPASIATPIVFKALEDVSPASNPFFLVFFNGFLTEFGETV